MSQEDAQPEYVAFRNYGKMPMHEVIRALYPWVSEEDAFVIAREANYAAAKLIYQDAMLLKYR